MAKRKRKMTLTQFMTHYEKQRHKFFITKFGRVRRVWEMGGTHYCFCPITAVCRTLLRKASSLIDYFEAGNALGLSRPDIDKIVAAADCQMYADDALRGRMVRGLKQI